MHDKVKSTENPKVSLLFFRTRMYDKVKSTENPKCLFYFSVLTNVADSKTEKIPMNNNFVTPLNLANVSQVLFKDFLYFSQPKKG